MNGFTTATIVSAITGATVVGTAAMLRRSVMYLAIAAGSVMVINSFKGDIADAYKTSQATQAQTAAQAHALAVEQARQSTLQAQARNQLEQERIKIEASVREQEIKTQAAVKQDLARLDWLRAQSERETQLELQMTRQEREAYQKRREAQRQAALKAEEERAAAIAAEQVRARRAAEEAEMARNSEILDNLIRRQAERSAAAITAK